MITVRAGGVKPPLEKSAPPPPRRIPFAFRADPVALDDLKLDPTARQVFTLILDNGKDRGWKSRLSNATMGRILGRCPMTISRALGRLEAAGLVRRELAAGGRIRLAVVVTWEGVAGPRLTGQAALRREHLTGSTAAHEGLGAGVELTSPPIQGEISDAARSSLGGEDSDAASRVASGPEAAAFLRACIEAGRRGEPMPPPPGMRPIAAPSPAPGGSILYAPLPATSGEFTRRPEAAATTEDGTPPKGITNPDALPAEVARAVAAPSVPAMSATAEVGRMVKALGERLKSDDVGRRRVGPKKLARQLAELRRRHGGKPAR